MQNALAKEFRFGSLLKFALPTIIMMLFLSLYTMVDGIFVSRFISTTALSAVNIVYPAINVVMAVGIMLATGSSAVIARKMGEGKDTEAKENFTFIILVGIVSGLVITLLIAIFIDPLLHFLGANEAVYDFSREYAEGLFIFAAPAIVQALFQSLFVTAGKPMIGLFATVAGGIANIFLDYLFIVTLDMGIAGAAYATGIGYCIPAVFGILYFAINKKGTLYFIRPKFDGRMLFHSCTNGSSEMVTNISLAVTTLLFNLVMMDYRGEDGVAAITIVMYAQFLLVAVFLGYSTGVAPVISYKYGYGDHPQLKKVFHISMAFVILCSVIAFLAAFFGAPAIVGVFSPSGTEVYAFTLHGFKLFAISYFFTGVNIFASSLFTAFSNGKVSALISFLRTLVFLVGCILLLPMVWGIDGVWLSVPAAEALAVVVSILFLYRKRKVYHYA
ncbi:MAG: MATE family efflux transporter [Christensenellaceae bacterium]